MAVQGAGIGEVGDVPGPGDPPPQDMGQEAGAGVWLGVGGQEPEGGGEGAFIGGFEEGFLQAVAEEVLAGLSVEGRGAAPEGGGEGPPQSGSEEGLGRGTGEGSLQPGCVAASQGAVGFDAAYTLVQEQAAVVGRRLTALGWGTGGEVSNIPYEDVALPQLALVEDRPAGQVVGKRLAAFGWGTGGRGIKLPCPGVFPPTLSREDGAPQTAAALGGPSPPPPATATHAPDATSTPPAPPDAAQLSSASETPSPPAPAPAAIGPEASSHPGASSHHVPHCVPGHTRLVHGHSEGVPIRRYVRRAPIRGPVDHNATIVLAKDRPAALQRRLLRDPSPVPQRRISDGFASLKALLPYPLG